MKKNSETMKMVLDMVRKEFEEQKEEGETIKVLDAIDEISKIFSMGILREENGKLKMHDIVKMDMINEVMGKLYNDLKCMEFIEKKLFEEEK